MQLNTEPKGVAAARLVIAIGSARGSLGASSRDIARRRWPGSPSLHEAIERKAAVSAMTPGSAGAGQEFISTELARDFIEAIRPFSVIDRLTAARRVPFVFPVPGESAAGFGGGWFGEGSAVPAGTTTSTNFTLPRTTAGVILVRSGELKDLTTPAHEIALRDAMTRATWAYLNQQFLDPSVTKVDNVTPASITSGATEVTSTGATGAAIKADFRNMLDAANSDLTSPIWIMRRRDAIYLAGLEGADGGLLFPNAPREILGIPTLLTSAVPATAGSPAEDRYVVLLDQESVLLADNGRLNVSVSTRATMEMRYDPQANSKTGNSTSVVSLFQTSSYAVKVVREIGWLRAHDAGVVFMQVSW